MRYISKLPVVIILGAVLLTMIGIIVSIFVEIPYALLVSYAHTHPLLGALLFGLLMLVATVLAPLAVLPLVPLMAPILGPFVTGLSAYVGWVLGAVIAFWLARRFGQSLVFRLVPERDIQKMSVYTNGHFGFWTIVILRLVIPVDALSYALGLFTPVTYRVYIGATMLGTLWFSFAFAYMGNVLIEGDYVLLAVIGVASVAILFTAWRYIQKNILTKKD